MIKLQLASLAFQYKLIFIVFAPLFGFFAGIFSNMIIYFKGEYLFFFKRITVHFWIFLAVSYSLFFSYVFFSYLLKAFDSTIIYEVKTISWVLVDSVEINWCFYVDGLTAVMLLVVTFISTCVHLYSFEYMSKDPHLTRFISYLSLFTFFMLILITANNFLQMFVGWEGVGVSSYLLINFWFTRVQANKAAIKAMLLNRIGDFALLLAIFVYFSIFNTLDYSIGFNCISTALNLNIIVGTLQLPVIDLICLLLFGGAMGKSAQIGLHTWLPDAMEGPTPVSALIHAATMVTAGVFLLIRCSYLFEFSSFALNVVVLIGSCTAFFAATTGLCQNDIKKIIAYSTCSQLGYMVFACGLSSYDVGLFHLSNHAFFKALLFLGAGSIIHALNDEQDLRKMGGLRQILPLSYVTSLVGSLALIGFPFLAGFYSKDVILEASFAKYTLFGHFSYVLGVLAVFCTAFYSTRLLYLVFLSKTNGNKNVILNAHEGSGRLVLPLIFLTFLSIIIGYMSKDLIIGFGSDFLASAVFINSFAYVLTDIEFLNIQHKILPLICTLSGCASAFVIYSYFISNFYHCKLSSSFKYYYNFFNKKWLFDRMYTEFLSQPTLIASLNYFYLNVDRGVLEKSGPTGLVQLLTFLIQKLVKLQSGFVLSYLKIILIFLSFFILITFLFI